MPRRPIKPLPSKERLDELLYYNPNTGEFRWKFTRTGPRKENRTAGADGGGGYRQIYVDNTAYKSHRLAWRILTGDDPGSHEIDHIDGNRSNNAAANLRLATKSNNAHNARLRADNTSGEKGVQRHKATGKFQASVNAGGKVFYLGIYSTVEAATIAVRQARERIHGEFANHG